MKKLFVLLICLGLISCRPLKNSEKGGAIGAGTGAVIGGVIGHQSGNTAIGAIIGAAVGGTAGALIGNYMDKQAEEMKRDLTGAKIERVGEGIKITFDSGLLFDVNSYTLSEKSKENLSNLSRILNKYDDTNILIEGHTDNTGTAEYNLKLSDNRANSVSVYLKSLGVKGLRITTSGYGESQPVQDNATEEGKAYNRRVEVAVFANKKLQKAAEKGDLSYK